MGFYTGHETIYDYLVQDIPDGYHTFQTVANGVSVDLEIEFINIRENTVYDSANVELGDDVPHERSLVVKYWGDLSIGHGVTLTSKVPKRGMFIHVLGNLLNRGVISMTAKGAKALGQDLYLWKNNDGTFEIVPAQGEIGAPANYRSGTGTAAVTGKNGTPAQGRKTGGGGSGGIHVSYNYSSSLTAAQGGYGTSYSGGGGSGGAATDTSTATVSATGTAEAVGGKGAGDRNSCLGIGGVGTVNGASSQTGTWSGRNRDTGAGGLLVIYCERNINFDYNSIVESKGVQAVTSSVTGNPNMLAGGGSSGGGSVNIFHRGALVQNGAFDVSGGAVGISAKANGGAGGTGTVTAMQINFIQNRIRFYNDQHKPITAMDMGFAIQGAYSPIAKFRAESMYLVPVKDLEIGWVVAPDSPSNEAILEFSKTESPFTPENPIKFQGMVLNYREGVEMFVRARSGEMQVEQTKFAITAKIEGV